MLLFSKALVQFFGLTLAFEDRGFGLGSSFAQFILMDMGLATGFGDLGVNDAHFNLPLWCPCPLFMFLNYLSNVFAEGVVAFDQELVAILQVVLLQTLLGLLHSLLH